jgi:hypothetical protein
MDNDSTLAPSEQGFLPTPASSQSSIDGSFQDLETARASSALPRGVSSTTTAPSAAEETTTTASTESIKSSQDSERASALVDSGQQGVIAIITAQRKGSTGTTPLTSGTTNFGAVSHCALRLPIAFTPSARTTATLPNEGEFFTRSLSSEIVHGGSLLQDTERLSESVASATRTLANNGIYPGSMDDQETRAIASVAWTPGIPERINDLLPSANAVGALVELNTFDILAGRGRSIQERAGNVLLHRVVDMHLFRYNSAPKLTRRDIAREIVRALKAKESRFLKQEQGGHWVELDEDAAIDKVAHCFRSRRRGTGI